LSLSNQGLEEGAGLLQRIFSFHCGGGLFHSSTIGTKEEVGGGNDTSDIIVGAYT
jgi:hypothetical protein